MQKIKKNAIIIRMPLKIVMYIMYNIYIAVVALSLGGQGKGLGWSGYEVIFF